MWSKKPCPVATAGSDARSRSTCTVIFVSFVVRSTVAVRGEAVSACAMPAQS